MLGLRERKKARTKACIQEHALRLFREQGYAQTTVEQIAAAAEVSPSTFFRYFPAKEDTVLTDLLDRRTFDLMVRAPAELTPLQALRLAVETVFRDASDEQVQLEVVRNDLIRTVPELRRGMLLEITRPHALLTEAIARRLGRPTDDEDARLYAGAVMGVLMTLALEGLDGFEGSPHPDGGDSSGTRPTATVERLVALIDRIERVVHLPPQ